jgi:hypothetical protein
MESDALKICPFCKEQIHKEAVKCRYCGEWLEEQAKNVTAKNPNAHPTPASEITPSPAAEITSHAQSSIVEPADNAEQCFESESQEQSKQVMELRETEEIEAEENSGQQQSTRNQQGADEAVGAETQRKEEYSPPVVKEDVQAIASAQRANYFVRHWRGDLWATLAKVVVIIGCLRCVSLIDATYIPQAAEMVRIIAGDMQFPAYQVRVLPGRNGS